MHHLTQELALHEQVQLTEMEIRQLCLTAKEIFMGQPNLLELEAPIKICGGCCTCLQACVPMTLFHLHVS